MATALEVARARRDTNIAATDQDNADAAERIEGSLTGSTLTQMITEQRNVRLTPIDGVAPSVATAESGAYPFSKTLYFVLPAMKTPEAERFIAFIRSATGQELLRANGSILIPDLGGR